MAKKRMKKNNGITITKTYNAPRDLVWKAWSSPEYFMKWWGPREFTTPVAEIDFRVGGKNLTCMRSSDGKDIWSLGEYREIIEPKRIVVTDSFADSDGNPVPASYYGMTGEWPSELLVTITLEEKGKKTRLTLHHAGIPPGEMSKGAKTGWKESFEKLAEVLKEEILVKRLQIVVKPGKQEIISSFIFDAPRDLVFHKRIDPTLIPKWWGPRVFTTTVDKMELRPGGIWRFVQKDTGGNEFAFHGVYHEITPPERIISTFEFEGMPGHVMLETSIFTEHKGSTKITTTSVFQSVEDRDGMYKSGMEEGVAESMDRFAKLLEMK